MLYRIAHKLLLWAGVGAPADTGVIYIGESQDEVADAVIGIQASTGAFESTRATLGTGVSGLYHDGTDLWEWDKLGRWVKQRSGVSGTVLNTYDFSGNADVNAANAFVGAFVYGGKIYAGNFVDDTIIRTTGLNAVTDLALDVGSIVGTQKPSCFVLDRQGNLIVANSTTNVIYKFRGFSLTLVDTIDLDNVVGGVGALFGLTVTDNNDLIVIDQSGPRFVWLEGFSETLYKTIVADETWDQFPQAVCAQGVLRAGTTLAGQTTPSYKRPGRRAAALFS